MPSIKVILILVLSFIIIVILGLSIRDKNSSVQEKPQVNINGTVVYVDIADTALSREQGLSGKPGLKDNEGMLFIFETLGIPSFWMKDMLFPIDIIWIGDNFDVVSIDRELSPGTYPSTFSSSGPVRYVLEVPSGFSEKNNVKIGDKVEFIRIPSLL